MKAAYWLYKSGIWGYEKALSLASPFVPKAQKFQEGRKGLLPQLQTEMKAESRERVWFHCASLGEFEQGRPVIEAFRQQYPDFAIVLTFFSPSGYEVRKNYAGADYIYYLPLDRKEDAACFVQAVNPQLAIFVKYEFWYHYLKALHEQGTPTLLISAIFRPTQPFFKPWGGFFRNILTFYRHIFVQDPDSLRLLGGLGLRQLSRNGDTRFDRVADIAEQARELPEVEAFLGKQDALVVGSSWSEDLEVLAPLIHQYTGRMKTIIAPHEIDERHLKQTEAALAPARVLRYSQFKSSSDHQAADVLLIDNIGMLSSLYALARFAYVGGAFGKGLHNTLEAAVYGIPVFFGNKQYHKFREANELIAAGGAFAVPDASALELQFSRLWEDEQAWQQAANACRYYVQENTGATHQIMDFIEQLMYERKGR